MEVSPCPEAQTPHAAVLKPILSLLRWCVTVLPPAQYVVVSTMLTQLSRTHGTRAEE